VALAVSLLFDAETSAAVEGLWTALAEAGVSRDMLDLNYPPHVTLVVVDEDGLEPQVRETLACGAGLARFPVTLGPPRLFEKTTISWLECQGGEPLRALHEAVCERLPLEAIRPYYRPGQWTPHMTLQTLGDPLRGVALAGTAWPATRRAEAIRLDVARFLPVVRLGGVDLAY
jgi:2'-5' RNA ligase